jgi:hypothetical protein
MKPFHLSNTAWKLLIATLVIFAATLLLNEISHAFKPLTSGVQGSLGIHGARHGANQKEFVITAIEPNSPLVKSGAAVGDLLMFDRDEEVRRILEAGETIGITLVQGGVARHETVEAIATPIVAAFPWDRIGDFAVSSIAMFFAMLIALKQPESKAYRSLSLYFVCVAFNFDTFFSPPGTLRSVAHVMWGGMLFPFCYFFHSFPQLGGPSH